VENHKRHAIFWRVIYPIVVLVLLIRFNFHTKRKHIKGPFILVSNHVTDWDPIFIGATSKDQMYFVASEHIMRLGFVSKLLYAFFNPITRQKGGSAAGTVKNILRIIKEGGNVALFPEGNRTWDGVTRDFPASTGKLVRSSGAALVTYRINGGYFASPRWAGNSARRGRVTGDVVNIYSPEELKAMTVTQINAAIAKDIHEDAYECQAEHPVLFKGKKLAEHLETLLFICPHCGSMHTLESSDNILRCTKCGFETVYDPTGYFIGGSPEFTDVRSWSMWQDEHLKELCENASEDEPIFRDSGFELQSVHEAKGSELLGMGEMRLFRSRLELPADITLPIGEITGMSLRGPVDLYIGTANGSSFLLHTEKIRNTVKYLTACGFLGADVGYGI